MMKRTIVTMVGVATLIALSSTAFASTTNATTDPAANTTGMSSPAAGTITVTVSGNVATTGNPSTNIAGATLSTNAQAGNLYRAFVGAVTQRITAAMASGNVQLADETAQYGLENMTMVHFLAASGDEGTALQLLQNAMTFSDVSLNNTSAASFDGNKDQTVNKAAIRQLMALNSALQHANATPAQVALERNVARDLVAIQRNGKGRDADNEVASMWLGSMEIGSSSGLTSVTSASTTSTTSTTPAPSTTLVGSITGKPTANSTAQPGGLLQLGAVNPPGGGDDGHGDHADKKHHDGKHDHGRDGQGGDH